MPSNEWNPLNERKLSSPSLGKARQQGSERGPDGVFHNSEALAVTKLGHGVEQVGEVVTMVGAPQLWQIRLEGREVIEQVQVMTARGRGLGFRLGQISNELYCVQVENRIGHNVWCGLHKKKKKKKKRYEQLRPCEIG